MNRLIVLLLICLITLSTIVATSSTAVQAKPVARWCGQLSSYTTWEGIKPAIFVWKGRGSPNPNAVIVHFDGQLVPDAGYGVESNGGPQIDHQDGWVGYYIAKRFVLSHLRWDDDWRWKVRGCIG